MNTTTLFALEERIARLEEFIEQLKDCDHERCEECSHCIPENGLILYDECCERCRHARGQTARCLFNEA